MSNINSKSETQYTGLEIAVVGMAGRFPGAASIPQFWENLKNGVDSVTYFTREELEENGIPAQHLDAPNYVMANAIMQDADCFDASFFGYTPREADVMDPQVRLFHQCAWEALEDAALVPEDFDGPIGVYAGSTYNLYWLARNFFGVTDASARLDAENLNSSYFTTLISYKLNLKGPNLTVQTACSTSLVAVHLACRALLTGECDAALAGGVTVSLPQKTGYLYQEGMINSPDGCCKAFDASANGIVGGNGVGVVVLKRLKDAAAQRDNIYAIVRGTAVNNDGSRKVGYTAPSVEGQAQVIRAAHHMARVEAESIAYIEAHGTGTRLGDPIEIQALKKSLKTDKKGCCAIGSVKTNIGHLDAAAGVSGFIKSVLVVKHRMLPPSLHYKESNPAIDFENSPFYVNTGLKEWEPSQYPFRAAVSSFGIGGTNAHAVLEEAPPVEPTSPGRDLQLLLLSANTQKSLDTASANLARYLEDNPAVDLADVAYTLKTGRKVFKYRKALAVSDRQQAVEALKDPASPGVHHFSSAPGDLPVVFMFPGQGSQYVDMGRELYEHEPQFREDIDRCFEILKPIIDVDLKAVLYPAAHGSDSSASEAQAQELRQTRITQPVIFIFQYAMARLLMNWGIKPASMIGHSIGEYVAACLSGVFSLEDALKLVALRGKLMQGMPTGSMLGVSLSPADLQPLIEGNEQLALAAVNSSSLCVVAGPTDAVEIFKEKVEALGHKNSLLHTSHAFHSPMMEPVLEPFEAAVAAISLNKAEIPFISNLTGEHITDDEVLSPRYWARHVRETVRFADGLSCLMQESSSLFLEIGPGTVLSTFVRQHEEKNAGHLTLNLARHPRETLSDIPYLWDKLARLWVYGIKIDWNAYYREEKRNRLSLPAYPFQEDRYPIEGQSFNQGMAPMAGPAAAGKRENVDQWFYIPSWKRRMLLPHDDDAAIDGERRLVFVNGDPLSSSLIQLFKEAGDEVITVEEGSLFQHAGENGYTLTPGYAEDYQALFEHLAAEDKLPHSVIHLWSARSPLERSLDADTVEDANEIGFYSLLHLAKAIGKQGGAGQLRLFVVSTALQEVSGEEVVFPERAGILGPCKVIPQEYPNISVKSIDILPPKSAASKTGGQSESNKENNIENNIDDITRQLHREIIYDPYEPVVALRGKHRWVQVFESLPMDPSFEETSLLKEEGVYLITGGLGGIGMVLAEHLANRIKPRLVLTGRSDFPPVEEWDEWLENNPENNLISWKIRKLNQLRELGAQFLILKADVSDSEAMTEVFHTVYETFGTLNGVIHAAGVIKGESFRLIRDIDKKGCEEHFLAKTYGLILLHDLLKGRNIDFCILLSSISSVLGGLTFVGDAGANIFMDYFVRQCNRSGRTRWISVAWDGWLIPRLNEKTGKEEVQTEEMAITPTEGVRAFHRALSPYAGDQLIVSTGDLNARIDRWIRLQSLRREEDQQAEDTSLLHSRPELTTPYIEPRGEREEELCKIWQQFFGFSTIGVLDNFFELGGDSLKAITVASKIQKQLEVELELPDIFGNPTIRELAARISQKSDGEVGEEHVMLLNAERPGKIFCFPPAAAYGMLYGKLADHLKSHSLYAFNYIEEEDRMRQYIDAITSIQPHGPYVLMGYSAGGNLAFAVAREMEKEGLPVSRVIIIDIPRTLKKEESTKEKVEEILEQMDQFISAHQLEHYREKILKKSRAYNDFIINLINDCTVTADVHVIPSGPNHDADLGWSDSTAGAYKIHKGYGTHATMFADDFIDKNVDILNDILETLEPGNP